MEGLLDSNGSETRRPLPGRRELTWVKDGVKQAENGTVYSLAPLAILLLRFKQLLPVSQKSEAKGFHFRL